MSDSSPYLKSKLSNGVKIYAEKIDTVQSVSIGFFIKSGVLYEDPALQGVSHLIEHMLFKGTNNRTAKRIAKEFDRIGGYLNAFTAKDYCCFYAKIVKDKIGIAIEILTDMILNSTFQEEELELERKVILEEIKMYEDSPDEIIHELLSQNLWQNSKIGKPILGTSETVASMSRDSILDVFHSHYVSGNIAVCVAGNFDWEQLNEMLEENMGCMKNGKLRAARLTTAPSFEAAIYKKNIEQVHLALGAPGFSFTQDERYPLSILNASFGGGMSSRLFQEIREKRGLAYTVYSYHTSFKHTGLFGIYAGTSMKHLPSVLELCKAELEKVAQDGLLEEEIVDTREQLKGNMLIALESTTNRMNRLATNFLYGLKTKIPEVAIQPYLNVTSADVRKVAKMILQESKMSITMVAPDFEAENIFKKSSFTDRKVKSNYLGNNDINNN